MMRRKARRITDARFLEISLVDKPANDLSTINAIRLAKRDDDNLVSRAIRELKLRKLIHDAMREELGL